MYKLQLYPILRFILVFVIGLMIYLILQYTLVYIYPLILAVILSLLINPFVRLLEKRLKFPRALATLVALILLFTMIVCGIILIVSELIQGTVYLADVVPAHFSMFMSYMEIFLENHILPIYHKLASLLHTLDPEQQKLIQQHIEEMINHLASTGTLALKQVLLKIPLALQWLPGSFAVVIFIILASFFITKDWPVLSDMFHKRVPASASDSTRNVGNHLKKALSGFLKAQIILITITGIIMFIGLMILHINHALTIALIASAVDLLPYVGTGIIFIPWIIYLFFTADYSMTIGLSILYMVIIVGRQILEPKLLSSSIGVHPLPLLIAVFLCVQLWGLIGIIIAPILVVLFSALQQAGVVKQLWIFIKG
ncbi:sporulation integral membrane protein YtvI [Lentibacillus sp. L22]|uniref:sporulation integral membrane protein YtvI n=1 Tax=Lentibacillus TaxID=175304 RepID=UPI0022B1AC50|nr:sporulation integral membrane protein YtvI [Lentibacillus daqui]